MYETHDSADSSTSIVSDSDCESSADSLNMVDSSDETPDAVAQEYCSIGEAMKLVSSPFDGDKKKLREFLDNVDVAFELVKPAFHVKLLKFVKAKITGDARSKLMVRDLSDTWSQVKQILEENYATKRTLDYYACRMFNAKQLRDESIASWGSRIDSLQTDLREAAGRVCKQDEITGAVGLINHLGKACFVQGLANDRIQTIVRSRGEKILLSTAIEISLEEESAILSAKERSGSSGTAHSVARCQNCNKTGHTANKCFLRKDTRLEARNVKTIAGVKCFNCGRLGHMARDCRLPKRNYKDDWKSDPRGKDGKSSDNRNRVANLVSSTAVVNIRVAECKVDGCAALDTVTFNVSESRSGTARFLVDTGADISIIKASSLNEGTVYLPDKRVQISGISKGVLSTLGVAELKLSTKCKTSTHEFQVVGNELNMQHDGILGKDFWQSKRAKINYLKGEIVMPNLKIKFDAHDACMSNAVYEVKLPARSEVIVRLPTNSKGEGLLNKITLQTGVFVAEALTTGEKGECIASIANTSEEEVTVNPPVVELSPLEVIESNIAQVNAIGPHIEKSERYKLLQDSLRLEHLNTEEKKSLLELCKEYADTFYLPGDKLSSTQSAEHAIPTPGIDATRAINVRPYRIPEALKDEVERQTKKMLADGIIVPSKSPWNSPIIVIPKKIDATGEKKWRIVIDFRKLNDVTVGDAFPLPNITEILDQLGKSRYFSTLDLASGFHQIPIRSEDRHKTAFSTPYGHMEHKMLAFGLKGAPATFQRLMNTVLSGLQGLKCLVYLDDIVLYGATLVSHNEKLKEVFDRLREHNLKLQPDKCEFLRREANYLGHVISEDGVRPDPKKIEAVESFPTPTTTKTLKGFLGLAGYYRRFLPDFSKIAKPLYELLKKDRQYEWLNEQEDAFQQLKNLLITEPVLQYPDFTKPFILTTDASDHALGAVLSQGTVGKDLPLAYASRTLNKAESRYSTIERELLAIVWATKYFRPYLYGRCFTIYTDHKPLTWIFNVKDPSSRLMRWRLKLEEYDYKVVYKKGSLNGNADFLSRINTAKTRCERREKDEVAPGEPKVRTPPDTAVEEKETAPGEPNVNTLLDTAVEVDRANVVKSEDKVGIEPDKIRKLEILREFHDSPMGGHQGMNRTYERLKLYFDWNGMKRDVEQYIKQCVSCQRNKITQNKTKMPLLITTTPEVVFEKCCLDVVGPLPTSQNNMKYLLTFQDELSKYTLAIPIEQQDAPTIAKAFVDNVVLKFGIPQVVLTDQGSNFLSELFKNTCKLLGVKKINSTSYHPETNGALERSHRTLTEYLRHFISEDQTNWDTWIAYAIFVFNTTPHTATGYTPHELMYGRKANIPGRLQEAPSSPQYTYDDYVMELRSRLGSSYEVARKNLLKAKEVNKKHSDKRSHEVVFKIDDKVLLHDETVRRGRSKKLSGTWLGPYDVLLVEGVNVTIKRKGNKSMKVHANRLKLFF